MHIAKTAASNNTCIHDPYIANGLTSLIERAGRSLGAIRDFLRSQIIKDPTSLDDDTKRVELKWNVWLLREGRVKEMVEDLMKIKQTIASALAAITTISTYTLHLPNENQNH